MAEPSATLPQAADKTAVFTVLKLSQLDLDSIQDLAGARRAITLLFNLIEELQTTVGALQAENQRLRDKNNRLKGEQGKPDIKANKPPKPPSTGDHSSEAERHKPQAWHKGAKRDRIVIDREMTLTLERTSLPAGAQFKGYEDVVVQDVRLATDNILFHKEKYYTASTGQTYLAPLPPGYAGQFGPGLKAWVLVEYYACNVAEPKLLELLRSVGVVISAGQLSNLLIKEQAAFHAEKTAVYTAGLRSSPWQHCDQTGTRVDGVNQQCHIVCNPLYTAFFTTASKDRLSVLHVLRNLASRTFCFNTETVELLRALGVAQRVIAQVQALPQDQILSEEATLALLNQLLPPLGPLQRQRVLEAAAVAAYHAQLEFPVIQVLLCDDAPQFNWLTAQLALCWVHEGRHYKKLTPCVPRHQQLLADFLPQFWDFYDELLAYRTAPTPTAKERIRTELERLFTTVTGYQQLDDRIAKTYLKKASLLLVLEHPELPLHNNPAELGACQRVRKRDISFGPQTSDGAKAWDTFQTLTATAQKLGVSIYDYILDRVSLTHALPSLADLITERAQQEPLGQSWAAT